MDTASGDERIDDGTYALLELRAAPSLKDAPEVPTRLGGAPPVVPPAGATVRHFTLQGHDAINGRNMDLTRIDEVVPANAVEIWEVENKVYSHNFHIHGVSFPILDRGGRPPPACEPVARTRSRPGEGQRPAGRAVRALRRPVAAVHVPLPHPAARGRGMMGQFLVVEPGTEARTSRSIPAPSGGHSGHPS